MGLIEKLQKKIVETDWTELVAEGKVEDEKREENSKEKSGEAP
ncbi:MULTISPECIES: hypothetical protein [Bacillaceae]|nr:MULTISPECIES: hypothetical protein [Bacillaceae]MDL0436324.1 hypothetical protein [Niallia sp. SS-2023]